MRLNPGSTIAGHPVKVMRDFLRRAADYAWSSAYLADRLDLSADQADETVERLIAGGLIEPDSRSTEDEYYRVTTAGRRIALASLAPPLKRETAERNLAEFLQRVEEVNRDPYYLYRVERVLLFGSMLTDAQRVGDVDLAVELAPKIEDAGMHHAAKQQRISEAIESGRRFRNIIAEASWPRREVMLHLKSRSRALSFHDIDDAVLEDTETRLVYEFTKAAPG